ncbi:hypothetical protein IMZ48_03395 [Candidatus Bathyarchaeota archaeon]|nr:hypothetical protein [Candidatus Bathyarchaeota archaeon]
MPSGEPSSTMMSSQSRLLGGGGRWVSWGSGHLCVAGTGFGAEGLDVLFGERPVQEPGHDGEVAALIVRRQDHRVLVLRNLGHCESFDGAVSRGGVVASESRKLAARSVEKLDILSKSRETWLSDPGRDS